MSMFKKVFVLNRADNSVREVTLAISPSANADSVIDHSRAILPPPSPRTSTRRYAGDGYRQSSSPPRYERELETPEKIYRKYEPSSDREEARRRAVEKRKAGPSSFKNKMIARINKFSAENPMFSRIVLAIVTVVLFVTLLLLILFTTSMLDQIIFFTTKLDTRSVFIRSEVDISI
jgi:hypothetical protein